MIEVRNGGLVTGHARIDDSAPRDTTIRPMTDQGVCGREYVERTLAVDDERVSGAIVWLHDIRTGKRLPVERRFEVLHEDCRIDPRVQAVAAGGALNVRSDDDVAHRTRFTHRHTGETLAVVRQTDAGSVVPVESVLARAGLIEIGCDVHPWTKGWVAVFDHPYFVLSDADGYFVLVDVPPGQYRLVAWHERLGSAQADVQVSAGREITVELVFSGEQETDG